MNLAGIKLNLDNGSTYQKLARQLNYIDNAELFKKLGLSENSTFYQKTKAIQNYYSIFKNETW